MTGHGLYDSRRIRYWYSVNTKTSMNENQPVPDSKPPQVRLLHNAYLASCIEQIKSRYPGPVDDLLDEDISAFNTIHICGSDKWYRMIIGRSSKLISYRNRFVEFELRYSIERAPRPQKSEILQQIGSWTWNELLGRAERYIVHVYENRYAEGLLVPSSQATPDNAEKIVAAIQSMLRPKVDIKVDEISGNWTDLVEMTRLQQERLKRPVTKPKSNIKRRPLSQ